MKGYKGFEKGLVCKGKQYAENTTFEEQGGKICGAGEMHFCENPFDVWDYYPVLDDDGNFTEYAEVEALDKVQSDGNKRSTKRLRIGAKLNFRDFIKAGINIAMDICNGVETKRATGNESQLAASGDGSKLAASGDGSKLAASGYWSQLAASGNGSKLAASGYWSQLAASGNGSKLAASGNESQLAASGNGSKLAASGDESKLAASGNGSKLAVNGTNSVGAAIGYDSTAKGNIGNWIVLAEWKRMADGRWYPFCVKAGKIDGVNLKPDTWYALKDGEFVVAEHENCDS